MRRHQTIPGQWLIVAEERPALEDELRRLPRGSGVLLLFAPSPRTDRRVRSIARQKRLHVLVEGRGTAARVHNMRELRHALQHRTELILLSPLFRTNSHPDWDPLPRMRGATLARLGGRTLVALGGMDARRFARIEGLGFQSWAGISAFRT